MRRSPERNQQRFGKRAGNKREVAGNRMAETGWVIVAGADTRVMPVMSTASSSGFERQGPVAVYNRNIRGGSDLPILLRDPDARALFPPGVLRRRPRYDAG